MKIDLYTIVWNEILLLPYFFRHYDRLVNRYVIFDDGSDDGTQQLLAQHPHVELHSFSAQRDSVCEAGRQLKSEAWKQSRRTADFVLVCDVDELLFHRDLPRFLKDSREAGKTVFKPAGWEMVSQTFPKTDGQIYEEVRQGFRSTDFDKPCLFDPQQIEEINYSPGCHFAAPTGNVAWHCDEQLRLLHFKHLGIAYVTGRYAALHPRLTPRDREHDWGRQYSLDAAEVAQKFAAFSVQDCNL